MHAKTSNEGIKGSFVPLCAGQLCGEGWHHVGEACLRINSSRESYDNAQHYCKNLGGNIASLLTDKQVNFVLEELQKYHLQDKVGGVINTFINKRNMTGLLQCW